MRAMYVLLMFTVLNACGSRRPHPSPSSSTSTSSTAVAPGLVRPEIVIEVDPARLAAHGLTLQDVQATLLSQHMTVAPSASGSFVVTTVSSSPEVLAMVIEYRDGVAIHLSDVARASLRKPQPAE